MTDRIRIRIAAMVTALFLAVISAAGIATHHPASGNRGAVIAPAAAQQTRVVAVPALGDDQAQEGQSDE